jgi:E3 ubiquitin-protein ligase DOA10
MCRYCLGNESSESDPMLSVCKCTGSVRSLHLGCLRDWVNSKL